MKRRQPRGFTLLEVLIALAILSLVVSGVMQLSQQRLRNLAHAEEKLAATQIATNVRREFRLHGSPVEPAHSEGEAMMGRWRFQWHRRVEQQPSQDRYRVKLDLMRGERNVQTLVWYVLP